MYTILLLGKNGQVGWELRRALAPLGNLLAPGRAELDLADADSLRAWVRRARPTVIVNAAAYNAVDQAESDRATAFALNAEAPGLLAKEAQQLGAALIHYSTDFVFDGAKTAPYVETDPPNPLSVYAQSKLAGELAVEQAGAAALVLRTAWVYSTRRSSFVTKILEWARKFPELRVVTDQTGSPTWCRMLAEATAQILAMGGQNPVGWLAERRGVYHLAGEGGCSRHEWAQAILRHDPRPHEQTAKSVQPATTADFPAPAARPAYSVLNCDRFANTFGLRLPPWEEALKMAMEKE